MSDNRKISVKKFVFNPFSVNTFLLWNLKTRETIVIDPGCSNEEEQREFKHSVEKENLKIKYLLNTHCHIDHIIGNKFVKETFDPVFIVPEKDLPLLRNLKNQAELFGIFVEESPEPDAFFEPDGLIMLSDVKLNTIFTPGHTPGEFSFHLPEEKILFSGDVLFKESIGRTDLWGGNENLLIETIKTKLFVLPDDTLVYPGHGAETTIGYEKKFNPFLNFR